MSGTLAVEFSHEGPVRVSNQQDGWIEHLNLFLTALVGLYADAAATLPVVLLSFETWYQWINELIMVSCKAISHWALTQKLVWTVALPTSVVQSAVEIEAASVITGHELDQVPYPGVACTRKTRKSHQGAGSLRQKHPLFAPGVWKDRVVVVSFSYKMKQNCTRSEYIRKWRCLDLKIDSFSGQR